MNADDCYEEICYQKAMSKNWKYSDDYYKRKEKKIKKLEEAINKAKEIMTNKQLKQFQGWLDTII